MGRLTKSNRRNYLKYACAGVIVLAVTAGRYYYQRRQKNYFSNIFIQKQTKTDSSSSKEKGTFIINLNSHTYLKKSKEGWIYFNLKFKLVDSNQIPINGVNIEISRSKISTDIKGETTVKNIQAGIHRIKVCKYGYDTKLFNIELEFPDVEPHLEKLDLFNSDQKHQYVFIAAYYGWYSLGDYGWRHWDDPDNPITTYFPLLGQFSGDALSQSYRLYGFTRNFDKNFKLIMKQMTLAKLTGISAFAVSWWGPNSFEDEFMPVIMEAAKKVGFKITIIFEPFYKTEDDKETIIIQGIHYIKEKYTNSEVWFRDSENKPVIFTFDIGRYDDWSMWRDILSENDMAWVAHTTDRQVLEYGFKYFYEYSPVKILSTSDKIKEIYLKVSHGKPFESRFIPSISPRYDDSSINNEGTIIGDELWDKSVEATNTIISHRKPPFIFITSWNEWHESTAIEPTTYDGFKFINAFMKDFKEKKVSEEEIVQIIGISDGLKISQQFNI